MITNSEFAYKLDDKIKKEDNRKYRNANEMNYSKVREEKLNAIGTIEKERVGLIVPLETEVEFYRSKYLNINKSGMTAIRKRNLKEYYCINDIELQELQEQEYQQMLKHYYYHKDRTTKCWSMFIRSYPIVDDILLDRLINETSTTKQQAYKKRIQWKRYTELNTIGNNNLFNELERLSPSLN